MDFFEDKICKICYINTLLLDVLTTRSPHCGLFCQNDQKYCFPSFLLFLPLFQLKENKWARAWYRHTGALSGAGNDLLFLVFLRFPATRAQILSMAKGELSTPWDGITSEGKGVALCVGFFHSVDEWQPLWCRWIHRENALEESLVLSVYAKWIYLVIVLYNWCIRLQH